MILYYTPPPPPKKIPKAYDPQSHKPKPGLPELPGGALTAHWLADRALTFKHRRGLRVASRWRPLRIALLVVPLIVPIMVALMVPLIVTRADTGCPELCSSTSCALRMGLQAKATPSQPPCPCNA